jgi:hypothetical protein
MQNLLSIGALSLGALSLAACSNVPLEMTG